MKKDVIIQARMGSTRLPGKVLKNLKGKSVLWHVIERIKQSNLIDDIIIATTTSKEDDQIVEFCKTNNVHYYRGSEDNVLKRYYETATIFKSDIVIRITSDCPLIDPQVIDKILEFFLEKNYDLVTNAGSDLSQRTYPRGLDTEIFSYKLLKEVYDKATEKHQIEHVTPYIYENNYRIYYYKNEVDYSNYRLTLDTKEDYELIKRIYNGLYVSNHNFYLDEIVNFLVLNNDLLVLNANNIQKSVINLRKVKPEDSQLLYQWVNDPLVRENSFESSKIKWEDHEKWFKNGLNANNREIFIAEINKQPIGQIRIDIKNGDAEIDYSIAENFRGKGYGKYLVNELILLIKRDKSLNQKINRLVGKVKKDNKASCKIFKKLGFTEKKLEANRVYEKIISR